MTTRRFLILLTMLLVAACSDSAGPGTGTPSTPGVHFLAGNAQTDTVQAILTQALMIEVRGPDGRPARDVVVRFDVVPETATVGVGSLASQSFGVFVADSTNDQGRAGVLVRLGTRVGTAHLVISVPELSMAQVAEFTVLAGAASQLMVEPSDTVVGVGASFQLRARVIDRFGNARSDPVTYSSLDGAATVSATGLVHGQSIGVARIRAQAAGFPADTVLVAIPPVGTIAATSPTGIRVLNLDGSGVQDLTVNTADYQGRYPTWLNATTLAAMDGRYYADLITVGTSGSVQYLVVPTDSVVLEVWPQASRDGNWIYFGGLSSAIPNATSGISVWRIQPNGTGIERISPANQPHEADTYPSPSPDGARVAIATTRYGGFTLAIINVATKQLTPLSIPGQAPRWAPAGDTIAFLGDQGEIRLVHSNGTGNRRLTPPNRGYTPGMDWSPDRQWIIARSSTLDLIHVPTGAIIPLTGLSGSLSQPTWKP